MKTKILIRKAKKGDEVGLAEMITEGLKRKNWLYNGRNTPPSKEKIKKMKESLGSKGHLCFIAIDPKSKKIIGSITGNYKTDGRLRHRIDFGWGVHPDYQGKGIATELLKKALVEAKKLGLKKAEAECAIENKASWKLAKKCRFKIEGKKEKALITDDGRYIDTYIVGRLL